jgi:hypothetical protein
MSEQAASAVSEQQDLRAELDRRQEEILRLRDLLIGKEAELGAAKGRLAELEDPRMQLAAAKRQIVARALARLGVLAQRLRGKS